MPMLTGSHECWQQGVAVVVMHSSAVRACAARRDNEAIGERFPRSAKSWHEDHLYRYAYAAAAEAETDELRESGAAITSAGDGFRVMP